MQLGAPRAPELGNPSFRKRGPSMARSRSRMKIMEKCVFFWGGVHTYMVSFMNWPVARWLIPGKYLGLREAVEEKGGGESYLATWLLQHTANSAVL